MKSNNELKEIVCAKIEELGKEICSWGDMILKTPELGYFEEKTSKYAADILDRYHIQKETGLALTGVKGTISGKSSDYKIAIIGELDAVPSPQHPYAEKTSGAAHACGHNVQVAQGLGAIISLKESGIIDELAGDVCFLGTPAEEFVDLENRRNLQAQGKIKYLSGKQQLIYEKVFEDIDMAMMIHSHAATKETVLFTRGQSLGFQAENIQFKGKSCHASTPYLGINALNAANLALMGFHANRESFRDEDKVRIHPIITKGGDAVNSVPDDVHMELYVRAGNMEALQDGINKVNRVVKAAAKMVGADSEIEAYRGYLPLRQDKEMSRLIENNAAEIWGKEAYKRGVDMIGSTDMGDLSQIIPCIQPTIGGFAGEAHSKDFKMIDAKKVYLDGAKLLAMTIIDLLYDVAQGAKNVKEAFCSPMSRQKYLDYLEGKEEINKCGQRNG